MIQGNLPTGTKVVVVDNKTQHNTPLGTKLTIKSFYHNSNLLYVYVNENGWAYFECDLELDSYTVEDITKELELAKQKVSHLENKIKYMEETNGSSFDENEFKAYNTLKTLENTTMSTLEKAKAIAGLFR